VRSRTLLKAFWPKGLEQRPWTIPEMVQKLGHHNCRLAFVHRNLRWARRPEHDLLFYCISVTIKGNWFQYTLYGLVTMSYMSVWESSTRQLCPHHRYGIRRSYEKASFSLWYLYPVCRYDMTSPATRVKDGPYTDFTNLSYGAKFRIGLPTGVLFFGWACLY